MQTLLISLLMQLFVKKTFPWINNEESYKTNIKQALKYNQLSKNPQKPKQTTRATYRA
jgi:hypothetical protein